MKTINSSERYAAFISYRHRPRDRRWALRIMAALETYKTPKPLQAEAFPVSPLTVFEGRAGLG